MIAMNLWRKTPKTTRKKEQTHSHDTLVEAQETSDAFEESTPDVRVSMPPPSMKPPVPSSAVPVRTDTSPPTQTTHSLKATKRVPTRGDVVRSIVSCVLAWLIFAGSITTFFVVLMIPDNNDQTAAPTAPFGTTKRNVLYAAHASFAANHRRRPFHRRQLVSTQDRENATLADSTSPHPHGFAFPFILLPLVSMLSLIWVVTSTRSLYITSRLAWLDKHRQTSAPKEKVLDDLARSLAQPQGAVLNPPPYDAAHRPYTPGFASRVVEGLLLIPPSTFERPGSSSPSAQSPPPVTTAPNGNVRSSVDVAISLAERYGAAPQYDSDEMHATRLVMQADQGQAAHMPSKVPPAHLPPVDEVPHT